MCCSDTALLEEGECAVGEGAGERRGALRGRRLGQLADVGRLQDGAQHMVVGGVRRAAGVQDGGGGGRGRVTSSTEGAVRHLYILDLRHNIPNLATITVTTIVVVVFAAPHEAFDRVHSRHPQCLPLRKHSPQISHPSTALGGRSGGGGGDDGIDDLYGRWWAV